VFIPENIKKIVGKDNYLIDNIGMSDSEVIIFNDKVLKIQNESQEAENEYTAMKWLKGKLPIPEVVCYEKHNGRAYLLMSKIDGKMSCDEIYMQNPDKLTQLLADGLKMLWQIDVCDYPYDFGLDKKLEMAKYNIEHGLVDLENAEPETFAENGFRSPIQLLEWLIENKPKEEKVFSHGDYCLPNIIVKGDKIEGFIDLSRAAAADKWQDIALCYRSLEHNFLGKYNGKAYSGFKPEMLFQKLGIEPNWDKIKYYILMDELF